MADAGASPLDDREQQMRLRERDLEERFAAKQRDVQAQLKRMKSSLEAERADWERHKAEQKRELAAREEKVRRGEDAQRKAQEENKALRKELDEARAATAALPPTKADVKATHRLEGRLRAAVARLDAVGAGLAAALGVCGALLALLGAWYGGLPAAPYGLPGWLRVCLVVCGAVAVGAASWSRQRIRRSLAAIDA